VGGGRTRIIKRDTWKDIRRNKQKEEREKERMREMVEDLRNARLKTMK